MGFKSWLIKRLVNKEVKKLSPSINDEAADELLKRTLTQYADTMRTAQKINKANLLNMKTRQLKEEIKAGLDDDDDEEEEEEEEEDSVEALFEKLILPLVTNKQALEGKDISKLVGMAQALPPEQLQDLLRKLKLTD